MLKMSSFIMLFCKAELVLLHILIHFLDSHVLSGMLIVVYYAQSIILLHAASQARTVTATYHRHVLEQLISSGMLRMLLNVSPFFMPHPKAHLSMFHAFTIS
jgi:hypothetical protein